MSTSLNILLVEDNEGDIEMTRRAFDADKPTCRVFVANDGLEAMAFLHKKDKFADAPTPRLILLDLNMPRMDGKKFLETMKADAGLKAIPVVMLTSSESATDIRECYERHASCYVVKPFGCDEFMDVVKRVVDFWNGYSRLP